VPLQPSCADSWLKPHPLSNKLAIVMSLGQWLPLAEQEESFTDWKRGPTWPEDCFPSPLILCIGSQSWQRCFYEAEPRDGRAACTLWLYPHTSPCPSLSAGAEPKPQLRTLPEVRSQAENFICLTHYSLHLSEQSRKGLL